MTWLPPIVSVFYSIDTRKGLGILDWPVCIYPPAYNQPSPSPKHITQASTWYLLIPDYFPHCNTNPLPYTTAPLYITTTGPTHTLAKPKSLSPSYAMKHCFFWVAHSCSISKLISTSLVFSFWRSPFEAMESDFDFCVIGAGLFGSSCAKYASQFGSVILVGPSEDSRKQV